MIKYTFWDYIEAFNKVFLYENPQKTHSWFIKVCDQVYKQAIPHWFLQWWISYGPNIAILPELYKGLYTDWSEASSKLMEDKSRTHVSFEVISSMHFFVEFSIPWIFKWIPKVDYIPEKFPVLKRLYLTKFWSKMMKKDKDGVLNSQDTVNHIHQKIVLYQEQRRFKEAQGQSMAVSPISPMTQIMNQMKKTGKELSHDEILEEYLNLVQKDLHQYLDQKVQSRPNSSTSSMSVEGENKFQYLAGKSQDPNEEDLSIDDIFSVIKTSIMKPQKTGECSGTKP